MFYQAFSRKMSVRGKKDKHNCTLLRTLQAEIYVPLAEICFF